MRILVVSMPSLHFFRWTEQLQDAGHQIYWFDVTDGGHKVERLHWVKQIVAWKLYWDFPGRVFIKKYMPWLYRLIKKINERNTATFFEQKLIEIQPDLVHSFALQIACIPIFPVMLKHKNIKWVYSSWGSDVFYFKKLKIKEVVMKQIFERINFLITDCNRDYEIARELGFVNQFMGIFPGNGGIDFIIGKEQLLQPEQRDTVLIKAYNDDIGKGIEILKSFDNELIHLLTKFNIVLFGADLKIIDYINKNAIFNKLKITIYNENQPIANDELLKIMGRSYLYIANSLSDGLPNALLEAMGMGCFPIQSNPGNVMTEIIQHGKNGYLIENPLDNTEIRHWISLALSDSNQIENKFQYSVDFIRERCNRKELKYKIVRLYEDIYEKKIEAIV
jgi:glycosyltransferase involved in cell wall biosynthesis